MLSRKTRKRLAMWLGALGIALMGVDLYLTRDFFTHIAELMLASIACFVLALLLDRSASGRENGS